MAIKLFRKIFGTRNDRYLKQTAAIVKKINALEDGLLGLSDDELKAAFNELKNSVLNNELSLDAINLYVRVFYANSFKLNIRAISIG